MANMLSTKRGSPVEEPLSIDPTALNVGIYRSACMSRGYDPL